MRHMVLVVACVLGLLVVPAIASADNYQNYDTVIYYSPTDNDIALVAPYNNMSLSLHFTYDLFLLDTSRVGRNITLRDNGTVFDFKPMAEKGLIASLFVNSSEFTLSVCSGNDTLISVHYFARGGFIPLPHWTPIPRPEYVPVPLITLSMDSVIKLGAAAIPGLILVIVVAGFHVYKSKQRKTTESDLYVIGDYYSPGRTNRQAGKDKQSVGNSIKKVRE